MKCYDVEAALVDLIDGRVDAAMELRLHDHIEGCAACRERLATWTALLGPMRELRPRPVTPARLRRMEAAIDKPAASVLPAPKRGWLRWTVAAAAVVAVAVASALVLRPRRQPVPAAQAEARPPSFVAGTRLSVPAGEQRPLQLSDALLTLVGPAHLTINGDPAHVALLLDEGRLDAVVAHRSAGQTFQVAFADGRVEVRGTRFTITAKPGQSWLRVDEGRVAAFASDGREALVAAGQTYSFAPPASATDPCDGPKLDCSRVSKDVRRALRAGQPSRAIAILDATASTSATCPRAASSCRDELGYLRAESLRASGKLDAAVVAYKALDRRDAPAATRQNALYAAAELERRSQHLTAARDDYERALGAAPRGALREEVMIGAMETADLAGDAAAATAAAKRYLEAFPSGMAAAQAHRIAVARREQGSAP